MLRGPQLPVSRIRFCNSARDSIKCRAHVTGGGGCGRLLPLLEDKDEFVRQEAAYALGQTRAELRSRLSSKRLPG